MGEHFFATLRAGFRSHALRAIAVLAAMLIGAAWLASGFSGRHPQTVALDVGISGVRIITVLLALFWVQELLTKEIDRRTVFIALSYPKHRAAYLLGRYLGIAVLLATAVCILGLAVYGLVMVSSGGYQQAFAVHFGSAFTLTLLYVWLDALVICAFATMMSSLATTALMPLVCGAAFAFAARSYGQVLAFLMDKHSEGADIAHIYVPLIDFIGWLLPDLGRLDIRDAALYGQYPAQDVLIWAPLGATAYLAVMLALACLLFQRREFN
ncbi:ABC transporter permease [Chitinimonas naiadis]